MKTQRTIIALILHLLASNLCHAGLYGPQGPMAYFTQYKGNWEIKGAVKMDGMKDLTEITSCSFSNLFDVFNISRSFHNGQISYAESVTIMNVSNRSCNAVFYKMKSPRYYYGTPDKNSKVFVLETLHPEFKGHKYLIIDFRPCPKDPPKFYTSDEKPKG